MKYREVNEANIASWNGDILEIVYAWNDGEEDNIADPLPEGSQVVGFEYGTWILKLPGVNSSRKHIGLRSANNIAERMTYDQLAYWLGNNNHRQYKVDDVIVSGGIRYSTSIESNTVLSKIEVRELRRTADGRIEGTPWKIPTVDMLAPVAISGED